MRNVSMILRDVRTGISQLEQRLNNGLEEGRGNWVTIPGKAK
jgi:hypothetical protein